MRKGMDIGTSAGPQATAVGIGMGAIIAEAHTAGIEARREAHKGRIRVARETAVTDLGGVAREIDAEFAAVYAEIA